MSSQMLYRYILSEGIPEDEAANYIGYPNANPSRNPDATSADPLVTRASLLPDKLA